jgi:hypothetical protein
MATIENIETSTERKEQNENMKDLFGGVFYFLPLQKEKYRRRRSEMMWKDEKRNENGNMRKSK